MKLGNYEFIRIKYFDESEKIQKALKIYKTNEEFFHLLSEEEGIGKEKIATKTVIKDLESLPPNVSYDDKYYGILIDEEKEPVGVLDLIFGYPKKNTAYIGLFVIDKRLQRKSIGRKIFSILEEKLADMDFYKIRLGVIKENINGKLFWESMGFKKINEYSTYIVMEKQIKIEPEKFWSQVLFLIIL